MQKLKPDYTWRQVVAASMEPVGPVFSRSLALSTIHLAKQDVAILRNWEAQPDFTYGEYDYGFFFCSGRAGSQELAAAGFSKTFQKMIQYCNEISIYYLRFDTEGLVIKEFRQHSQE